LFIVTGQEFRFPIEYTPSKAVNLNPATHSVKNFAKTQEKILSKSREIFKILIHEHRAMHREYVNSQRPDPLSFQLGDRVFAKRAVKPDKKRGRVGKIMIKHTGPWEIIEKLDGSSYRIRHCRTNTVDKKHAAHLSPWPEQLIPFPPLSGPDNNYSQIHRQIKKHPYMEAGIDEYDPTSIAPMAESSISYHRSLRRFHLLKNSIANLAYSWISTMTLPKHTSNPPHPSQ
jgi:hypothetical protein